MVVAAAAACSCTPLGLALCLLCRLARCTLASRQGRTVDGSWQGLQAVELNTLACSWHLEVEGDVELHLLWEVEDLFYVGLELLLTPQMAGYLHLHHLPVQDEGHCGPAGPHTLQAEAVPPIGVCLVTEAAVALLTSSEGVELPQSEASCVNRPGFAFTRHHQGLLRGRFSETYPARVSVTVLEGWLPVLYMQLHVSVSCRLRTDLRGARPSEAGSHHMG